MPKTTGGRAYHSHHNVGHGTPRSGYPAGPGHALPGTGVGEHDTALPDGRERQEGKGRM